LARTWATTSAIVKLYWLKPREAIASELKKAHLDFTSTAPTWEQLEKFGRAIDEGKRTVSLGGLVLDGVLYFHGIGFVLGVIGFLMLGPVLSLPANRVDRPHGVSWVFVVAKQSFLVEAFTLAATIGLIGIPLLALFRICLASYEGNCGPVFAIAAVLGISLFDYAVVLSACRLNSIRRASGRMAI
jgi:hypothetical protein